MLADSPDLIHDVDPQGWTALHAAAVMAVWKPEVMALILAAASPRLIHATDKQGWNALHRAVAFSGHLEAVEQLLAAAPSLINRVVPGNGLAFGNQSSEKSCKQSQNRGAASSCESEVD